MAINNYEVKEYIMETGEQVTNGGFEVNTNGWSGLNGGILSAVDGQLLITNSLAAGGRCFQTLTGLKKGHRLKIIIDYDAKGANGRLYFNNATIQQYNTSGIYTHILTANADDPVLRIDNSSSTLGDVTYYNNVSIVEIPPLEDFKTGTKYLECQTADTTARQSNIAYGTWEFLLYKNASNGYRVNFISDRITATFNNHQGYRLNISSNEDIQLANDNVGSSNALFQTINSYINNNTWYDIKIARLQSSGVFKDIETLQTSDLINNDYTTFTNNGRYGFSAISDGTGTQIASTADEIPIVNTVKYLVEFDLILNSGTVPGIGFRESPGTGALSSLIDTTSGRNSIILTATGTNTGVLIFRNGSTTTDYTISGLTIKEIYDPHTFAVFIKGGSFGEDTWTLVDTTGGNGTNPITDSTYTESKQFVIDLDAQDSIGKIKIKDGVEQ